MINTASEILQLQDTIDALKFSLTTSCGNLSETTVDLILNRIHELKEILATKHP
jgi:hypothetical protein